MCQDLFLFFFIYIKKSVDKRFYCDKIETMIEISYKKGENMSEIKIEKNVPIPISSKGLKKYPFEMMEPGDSIYNDNISIIACARRWFKRHNPDVKVISRKEKNGVRIWVVKA